MPCSLTQRQVDAADAAVEAALAAGDPGDLPVIGFGEVTTVLAWPPDEPTHAVKRLPIFRHRAHLERYCACVADYVGALEAARVRVTPTTITQTGVDARGTRAFMVQPLAASPALLSRRLRSCGDDEARALLGQLCKTAVGVVGPAVGLDAQASNWIVTPAGLECLDVSTPMLRDAHGLDRLDGALITSVYPAVVRPALRRWAVGPILAAYHDVESVLRDVGANLHREGLGRHVPALCHEARQVDVHLTEDDVRRYVKANLRMWRVLAALRRVDARWQRRVRRRPYPSLLPPRSSHG